VLLPISDDVPQHLITSSLHIIDMELFVGLLNDKLLMVDLSTMSPLAVSHCHEDQVKLIFSLQVIFSEVKDVLSVCVCVCARACVYCVYVYCVCTCTVCVCVL